MWTQGRFSAKKGMIAGYSQSLAVKIFVSPAFLLRAKRCN
jgi:hypothetical protein